MANLPMSGLKNLDARSLYQQKFADWKQDPAVKDPKLKDDIAKSSQNLADNLMKDKNQQIKDNLSQETGKTQFNLGKSLLNGVSSLGRGIGNFAINTGIWKDFNPEKGLFSEDEDGNKHFDFGQAIGNGLGNTGRLLGFASNFIPQQEQANNKNNQMAQEVASTVGQAAMKSGNPFATLYGGALLMGQKLGINNQGSDTGNTGIDLANSALSLAPGLGLLGKKAGTYHENAMVNASHSYGNIGDQARKNSNGRFIVGGNKIKNSIEDANRKTVVADSILTDAKRDFTTDIGMIAQRINMDLTGGPDRVTNFGPAAAKQGAVLQFTKRTLSKHKIKKQQDGGKVQQGRTLDELVDYVEQQNPPFWKRMSGQDRNYIANDDGSVSSLRMTYSEGKEEPYADVYPLVQYDLNGNLKYYFDPNEAYAMAKLRNDIVRMSREEAKRFTEGYKDSTKLKSYYRNYHPTQVKLPKEAWNWEYKTLGGSIPENEEIIEEFKEGGKVNVIPDGALHKNKHHLEEVDEKFEDVTTKGIPVIVESEDGEVIQQAEVEREEIIFRLEVTKKLEELSKKHTDEAAIEAGKLLVKEILYNTEDNTGKMI